MTATPTSSLFRVVATAAAIIAVQLFATPAAGQEGNPHMATVDVIRRVDLVQQRLAGFEARHRSAPGRFLTSADVARKNATVTSDIFRGVSGLRVELEQSGASRVIKMRGGSDGTCKPSLFVDGRYMPVSVDELDTLMQPRDVAGIEVYFEGNVPADFNRGTNDCGGILIWTK